MNSVVMIIFFPGPKYILKLQQEVTAMRVMISMDTHTHVDGASKVHTIKRYLSEHKDDSVINTSSLRCRELDCLRAYYYVAILNFLKESCFSEGTTQEKTPSKGETDSIMAESEGGISKVNTSSILGENASEDHIPNTDDMENCNVKVNAKKDSADDNQVKSTSEKEIGRVVSDSSDENLSDMLSKNVDEKDESTKCPELVEDLTINNEQESSEKSCSVKPKQNSATISQTIPVLNVNHYSITVSQLAQLSRGILWDLQAKRYALTETLGYIHKAISQLLLSKTTQPSETTDSEVNKNKSSSEKNSQDDNIGNVNQDKMEENGASSGEASAKDNTHGCSTIGDKNCDNQSVPEGAVAMATEKSFKDDNQIHPSSVLNRGDHVCSHHTHESHVEGHICPSVLSHHFDQIMNIHVPHGGDVPVHCETETELKCSYFEVCSACELLHKSRKILFEDEPRIHTRPDVGFKDITNITNPAKYINVPDEWYGMPVDQKYSKRYITMAILKEEQEYVMGELKRGPDSTQVGIINSISETSLPYGTLVKCIYSISKAFIDVHAFFHEKPYVLFIPCSFYTLINSLSSFEYFFTLIT